MQGKHSKAAKKNKNYKGHYSGVQGQFYGFFLCGIMMHVFAVSDSKRHARRQKAKNQVNKYVA